MTGMTSTPAQVWGEMERGNERFVAGEPLHPRQDVEHRAELAAAQHPSAALFGCSDSRLAAEIIFDKGLGDLFVVRNAGQIISDSVIGSLEFAVAVLKVPLIIVLGHDNCGAVRAAILQPAGCRSPPPAHRATHRPDRPGCAARGRGRANRRGARRRRGAGYFRGRPRAPARHRGRVAGALRAHQ